MMGMNDTESAMKMVEPYLQQLSDQLVAVSQVSITIHHILLPFHILFHR